MQKAPSPSPLIGIPGYWVFDGPTLDPFSVIVTTLIDPSTALSLITE